MMHGIRRAGTRAGVLAGSSLAWSVAIVWFAHIGMDRALGYGPKYPDSFRHTHLGWIGRLSSARRKMALARADPSHPREHGDPLRREAGDGPRAPRSSG